MHIIIYDALWKRKTTMRENRRQPGRELDGRSNGRDECIRTIDTKRQSGRPRQTKQQQQQQQPAYFAFAGNAEITNPHHGRQFVLSRSFFEVSPLVCTYQIKHARDGDGERGGASGWFHRVAKRGFKDAAECGFSRSDPDMPTKTEPLRRRSIKSRIRNRVSAVRERIAALPRVVCNKRYKVC